METTHKTFFTDINIDEDFRREIAFQSVIGVREAVSIAKKAPQPITYEHSLDFIRDIAPDIYEQITKLLSNKNESDEVKYFKSVAEAKSTYDVKVTPEELILAAIEEHEVLLENADDKKYIAKRIVQYKSALEYFLPRNLSEHRILNRDFYLADRGGWCSQPIYKDDHYIDYALKNSNILRLRLLHPDNAEAVLGVDLIYEIFDLGNNRVRFCHIQYKTWNTKVLYLNDERMTNQLSKIESHLCKKGFCKDENGNKNSMGYRLPYCAGFLRPTSKLQTNESKLISTGLYVPICEVEKIRVSDNKITSQNIESRSISSKNFEDLFNENLIGSRWITIEALDKFYEDNGIKSMTDSVRVHAQEFILPENDIF